MKKIYVLTNEEPQEPDNVPVTLEYDYGGETYRLEVGETEMTDFNRAQHVLKKFQMRGVTLREE